MTVWRVAVATIVLFFVGLPLLFPYGDLISHRAAWQTWLEYPRLLGLLRNTIFLVVGTLALALPAGTIGAVLLYRTDLPGRRRFRFLTLLTLFIPLPLFASGWQAALGSGGWLPLVFWSTPSPNDPDIASSGIAWKPWAQGLTASIWIHAVAGLPWVILLVGQGLCWVERELEEDALLATTPWRVLTRVTLRRGLAAIGGASLWIALQAATEITITDMLQIRTFAEEVYTQFVVPEPDPTAPDPGAILARAVAVGVPVTCLISLLTLVAASRWEQNLPPLRTATREPLIYRLGSWRWLCLAGALIMVALLVGMPVGSLIWKAGLGGSPPMWSASITAHHLGLVWQTRHNLLLQSLGLAATAGVFIAGCGLLACWLAAGTRWFHLGLLILVAIAWSAPGPVVGLGLKPVIKQVIRLDPTDTLADWLYYGPSPLPVLWAYGVRFFPYAVAVLWPQVRLVPIEQRDAARIDGARPIQEFRYVIWPWTARVFVRAALAVAILSLGELSASKMVETASSPTFSHEVFTQMHYGVTNNLAALCLILLCAVLLGSVLITVLGWWWKRWSMRNG